MQSRRSLITKLIGASLVASAVLPAFGTAARLAPDFDGIESWLNTSAPLTLAGLRGQVVLVDFWTYSCINCRRTVPYLNRWQDAYGAHGLQVVGIHTPEFGFEHARPNVAEAVRRLGIRYPVGQDNRALTWRAWDNQAWPAFYLIDRSGRIPLVREGEGHAREIESAIRALLGLPPALAMPDDDPDLSRIATAEIYFGASHSTPQDRSQQPRLGEAAYTFPPGAARIGEYQLDGTWARQDQALLLHSARGGLRLRFSAAKLHLVASSAEPATLQVSVDGAVAHPVEVQEPTLYTLHDSDAYGEHVLTLEASRPGLSLYSATFG